MPKVDKTEAEWREQLTPEQLSQLMNAFLTPMTAIVQVMAKIVQPVEPLRVTRVNGV